MALAFYCCFISRKIKWEYSVRDANPRFARWHDVTRTHGMTKKRKFLQARKTNRIDEFSEKGQADKFPLKNGDLFT